MYVLGQGLSLPETERPLPSFVVTGASASGKTTLVEEALQYGYAHLPTETTRSPRVGETPGVHSTFIEESAFQENFVAGKYLEESLEYARVGVTRVYYGTPKSWLKELRTDGRCATPIAPDIARVVLRYANVQWIHLVCDDLDRAKRLRTRGISEREVVARMNGGHSIRELPEESVVINTSEVRPAIILQRIMEHRS